VAQARCWLLEVHVDRLPDDGDDRGALPFCFSLQALELLFFEPDRGLDRSGHGPEDIPKKRVGNYLTETIK